MVDKRRRQAHVIEILERNEVDNQDALLDLLLAEGVETTQSTLSRDLRELGVIKSPSGYRLPRVDPRRPEVLRQLAQEIRAQVSSIDVGGNIVVLQAVDAAAAAELAQRFNAARLHQAVTTIAVGSTILVVARTAAYARDVARRLRSA